ncbi:MAG: cysteine synthase A [Bacillota bacterium]
MQKNILDGIGDTPLFNFENYKETYNINANVYAKLEKYNPQGSIKDRVAKYMIEKAMENGVLKVGGTIIEPTSGNTGIGLAYIGKQLGVNVVLTMPASMSIERVKYMEALGAQVILTDKTQGMKGAIAKAKQLECEICGAVILDQFANLANPLAHFETTAPEIFSEMNGEIDVFICGIGTGGTISGIGKYLKERLPNVEIIGIEPAESPVITKGSAGAHKIQGIGAGFVPDALDTSVVDRVITVSGDDAFKGVHMLSESTSLLVGISSGANFFGACEIAKQPEYAGKNIVTVFPDGGDKYFSVEGYL